MKSIIEGMHQRVCIMHLWNRPNRFDIAALGVPFPRALASTHRHANCTVYTRPVASTLLAHLLARSVYHFRANMRLRSVG